MPIPIAHQFYMGARENEMCGDEIHGSIEFGMIFESADFYPGRPDIDEWKKKFEKVAAALLKRLPQFNPLLAK
eukprot:3387298-Amphidinium_carterae.1